MAVEIYTKVTCGFCMRAKMLLDQKNIAYREIRIDSDMALRTEMMARSNGRYTVPQIFINDVGIGGCDELFNLYHQGELDALLSDEAS